LKHTRLSLPPVSMAQLAHLSLELAYPPYSNSHVK
jgi:hypothetical protein